MPLPLLIGGAILLAGVGAKKGYDASETNDKADRIIRRSKEDFKEAKEELDEDQSYTNSTLEQLGECKVNLFTTDIKLLIDIIQRCKDGANSEFDNTKYITENELNDLKSSLDSSLEIKKGLAQGVGAGVLTGLGAYGAVGALASASTGTAIAGLSGAAATNATLAWLGGGSLAAGGGGMALGTAVLGGLVAGPLIAVGGLVMNSAAEKNLTNAREFESDADIAIEQMTTVKVSLQGVRERSSELESALEEISARFNIIANNLTNNNMHPVLKFIKNIFRSKDICKEKELDTLLMLGKTLKNLLDIPVLDEDGNANLKLTSQIKETISLQG